MKTPEEIFDILLKVSELRMDIETAEKKIIDFGKQQYNKAIKDAAENAKIKPKHKLSPGFMDQYTVDKDSILKLLKP